MVTALPLMGGAAPAARAVTATPVTQGAVALAGNPLAGGRLGVYTGRYDEVAPHWAAATGAKKELLAKVALRPRMRWFGAWYPTETVTRTIREYVENSQGGNPDAVVQLAIFRIFPYGEQKLDRPLTQRDRTAYRAWVDRVAEGIGSARVSLVLEPDLALALEGWRPEVRLALTRYAAKVFSALPRTSVYIDATDADWIPVPEAATLLRRSGIEHARGFALGATHYASTAMQVRHGAALVQALAAAGYPDRHFVVDTADNGRPFTWLEYYAKHPRGDFDNAEVCRSKAERRCVTLGIPPTRRVGAKAWRLPADVRALAREHVDAYLWFGRPYLHRQAAPFRLDRTLAVARTTPF